MAVYKQNSWGKKIDFVDIPEGSAPANPSSDTARLYCKDSGGVTKLFYRDSAGNERELSFSNSSMQYIHLQDVKSNGTAGGAFQYSSTWSIRDLNTIATDDTGEVTLNSNRFTLPAGTYRIRATSPAFGIGNHKIRLYNYSDSETTLLGCNANCYSGDYGQTHALLCGQFTISASKTFEIDHITQDTQNTNGRGLAGSFSVSEIYTVVELWKIS